MSKSFKVAAVFAVTALILGAAVFGPPVYGQTSNTNNATAGVFSNDVDKSLSVHDYSGVAFDKWFGFIGYGGSTNIYPIQLGYATRFDSGLYLGTYYSGNIIEAREDWDETVRRNFDPADQTQTSKITSTVYGNNNTIGSTNQIQVLIGAAGMGFRVGFRESVTETTYPNGTITITENKNGTVTHTDGDILEYSKVVGSLTPSLRWGTVIALDSFKVRPVVEATVNIGLNSEVNDYLAVPYTTIDGELIGTETINHEGNSSGYVNPNILVGARFDFAEFKLEFSYNIGFSIYNNSYDASGLSGSTPGTVSWANASTATATSVATTQTTNQATLTINEQSDLNHGILLGVYFEKEVAEGLKLGLRTGTRVYIDTYNWDEYTLTLYKNETRYNNAALSSSNTRTENETRTFGKTTDYTRFRLNPFVNVGATYALVPGRFTVNAGVGLTPFGYSSVVTRTSELTGDVTRSKTYNDKGDVTSETVTVNQGTAPVDTVTVNNTWSNLGVALRGGFAFNFTDSMSLDTYIGSSSTFTLDATVFNVLFSVKF